MIEADILGQAASIRTSAYSDSLLLCPVPRYPPLRYPHHSQYSLDDWPVVQPAPIFRRLPLSVASVRPLSSLFLFLPELRFQQLFSFSSYTNYYAVISHITLPFFLSKESTTTSSDWSQLSRQIRRLH